jgi:membrane-bound lytic murein transglycosylase MltF
MLWRCLRFAFLIEVSVFLVGMAAGCDGDPVDVVDVPLVEASLESGEEPGAQESEPRSPGEPVPIPLAALGESTLGDHVSDRYSASLERVIEERFLRVLTSRNAFDYFIHHGDRGGYQYEMVKAFTRHLNQKYARGRSELPIQFELMPVDDDQLIPMLRDGAADLIAARLTITGERAKRVRFSKAYRAVDELLVTHDETPPIDGVQGLSGRVVVVRRSSSYYESLVRLNRELEAAGRAPVAIEVVDEALETERILDLVAARRYPFTLADSMVARLAVEIQPRLRIVEGVMLRKEGELAWATQMEATALLDEMNSFLDQYDHGTFLGNLGIRLYFKSESKWAGRLTERDSEGQGKGLSDHDGLFKQHGEPFGLDWLLVASMAYQESRFDQEARNRSGAVGLMQIKPTTAREPYVGYPEVQGDERASENVAAGLKYLNWIKSRYFDPVPEMHERDRLRMALAAYNAGPRAIARARNRARKLGYDPNRWFRNVELALLDMRLVEPVKYVSEINQRYLAYRLLGLE